MENAIHIYNVKVLPMFFQMYCMLVEQSKKYYACPRGDVLKTFAALRAVVKIAIVAGPKLFLRIIPLVP
jgi:hypothetical protein